MDSFFFRVEHDLLKSESFKALGGSAIKVYLVIGLYADFGTGWAYPSIRTIAKQAGLSRQTVLAAIGELTSMGLLATKKSKGRSTAYKVIRHGPPDQPPSRAQRKVTAGAESPVPILFREGPETGPDSLAPNRKTGPDSLEVLAQFFGPAGREPGPERDPRTKEDSASIPIPGTPFRLSAEGRLLVAIDLQELLTDQGLPPKLAEKLAAQKAPEDVAKVLLNAFYLKSQGKLQNGPGYIRAGLEDGYDLLPQVANRLETRRRELESQIRVVETQREKIRQERAKEAEDAAIALVIANLSSLEIDRLVERAVAELPEPLVRRNPTLSNPFVRGKVYELAGGDPLS
jgi:hypothetical protein